MFKLNAVHISEILTIIINTCILNSVFPEALKFVKVVAVHKKGSKSDCNSFRPTSLVPVISKVFEKILNKQIITYFDNNNLFSECQYGYRVGMGTIKATVSGRLSRGNVE